MMSDNKIIKSVVNLVHHAPYFIYSVMLYFQNSPISLSTDASVRSGRLQKKSRPVSSSSLSMVTAY